MYDDQKRMGGNEEEVPKLVAKIRKQEQKKIDLLGVVVGLRAKKKMGYPFVKTRKIMN